MMRYAVVLVFAGYAAAAIPGDACKELRKHGKMAEARACFTDMLRSSDAFARAEGQWGLEHYQDANSEFRAAEKRTPNSAPMKTEWGLLFLERFQPGDAAKLFAEAISADANYAPAYLGMARAAAVGFDEKAVEMANAALQHDPKLYQAHEVLAFLALEDNDEKRAAEEAQKALAISGEALDAMAVLASVDWLNDKPTSDWMQRILKINPVYGEAYAMGGHFFDINRRYDEAIECYRKALALNGNLWDAHTQLGVNLMRQGKDAEARQELVRCYEAHASSEQTRNSLKLLDSLKNFETFKIGNAEVRLNKEESALLRPYVEAELERTITTYERKYGFKLPGPVHLEMYPNHEDFVVRTLGMPGQGGLLGVTFGLSLAMDSPSARPPGQFNWASTLWHEMSHVFLLTATRHLVPRWFTEGVSVHEEGAAAPEWGDRLTPEVIAALDKKQLLPVLELDRGFLRPKFPTQVIVSYFEAGQICDFISQKWGDAALVGMIHSFAARKTTEEAIVANLHESAAAFDKEFAAWLDKRTGDNVKHFADWKQGIKKLHETVAGGKWDEVIRDGAQMRDYFPGYTGPHSAYEALAEAYEKKGDRGAAMKTLLAYREHGGSDLAALKKLARWQEDAGDSKAARTTLAKLNYIYPEDEEIHRRLSTLLLAAGDSNGAVREGKALLALKPADPAESHYQLAKALQAAHRLNEAKDQVVLSLEAAPGYKPAQQLLLQLSQ